MGSKEDKSQIGTQRNMNPSQLSDPSVFNPPFVSTPKEGNKEDRSGQGAGVQPAGGALPELVIELKRK